MTAHVTFASADLKLGGHLYTPDEGPRGPRPAIVVGHMAVTSYMTAERFWNAQQPKELHWIDGATHVSLYDKESHVTLAIAKLSHFFRSRLGESTSGDRAWRQAWTDDAVHTGSP